DASESGDDVFFLTAAQLSKRDTDTADDIYDARVDGSEPEPVAPVECLGDACQSAAQPPNDPTPDSLTYQGPGNLAPLALTSPKPAPRPKPKPKPKKCSKGQRLLHKRCIKSKAKPNNRHLRPKRAD